MSDGIAMIKIECELECVYHHHHRLNGISIHRCTNLVLSQASKQASKEGERAHVARLMIPCDATIPKHLDTWY